MSEKIRRACAVALAHGYSYIWIDSCCIDKTSSAELSEAINSMYTWYQNAAVSYAFLADVPSDQNPRADNSAFRQSRWFTRGWTLQELLAPPVVFFLSRDWQVIGTKTSLGQIIENITTIPFSVLTFQSPLRDVSVARRLSWASNRRTTRVEDEAYSLIGIFDINMPTLYGEGQRAFIRLQEEILRRIPDQTLFTWGSRAEHTVQCTQDIGRTSWMMQGAPLFAPSVANFASPDDFQPISHGELSARLTIPGGIALPTYTLSSYGVHTQVPLLSPMTKEGDMELVFLLVLACELSAGSLIAVVCHVGQHSRGTHSIGVALHGGVACCDNDSRCRNGRLVILLPEDLKTFRRSVRIQDVYLDPGYFRSQNTSLRRVRDVSEDGRRIHLTPWSWDSLRRIGYTVAHDHLMQNDRTSLILHNDKEYINITLGRDPWMRQIILDEPVRCLDSNTTIRGVHTGRLRLITTVVLTCVVDASYNMNITYTGRSEFCSPSDGPGTCEVTMSWSLEANLLLFDIMLAYSP